MGEKKRKSILHSLIKGQDRITWSRLGRWGTAFFFFWLQCLCREICWHGWHLFGCVTFLTRFQLESWEEEERRWGCWDRVLSLRWVFFFFHVCENAKRAAPYNGGVMVEAVRGVLVKDTLGSASRRTGRWGSFVFLTSLRVGKHKSPTWKMNVTKQDMSWPQVHTNSQGGSFPLQRLYWE